MPAPLIKTKTPGIFKRGRRYVFSYRVEGKQRWESCRTLEEARRAKSARQTDIGRGEFEERSRITLRLYLIGNPEKDEKGWIDMYRGTGKRGYREETRDEDRRLIEKYVLAYFPPTLKLTDLKPGGKPGSRDHIAGFIAWLCEQPSSRGGTLSDRSVRNALRPLRSALATARRDGLIRYNPAAEAALPHREEIDEDEGRPRPFPNGTMELVVSLIHPRHRAMYELLAATGVRRSELLAFEVRHLALDGDGPHVQVRQRVRRRKGSGLVLGALKSRHARRELPIPLELADRLRPLVAADDKRELVFRSTTGTILDPDNLHERVLAPACAEAGVEWAGHHTFRHTVASRLFAEGRNIKQIQKWLGHHSPEFTLKTYIHLIDEGDLGGPLIPQSANKVQTGATPLHAIREPPRSAKRHD